MKLFVAVALISLGIQTEAFYPGDFRLITEPTSGLPLSEAVYVGLERQRLVPAPYPIPRPTPFPVPHAVPQPFPVEVLHEELETVLVWGWGMEQVPDADVQDRRILPHCCGRSLRQGTGMKLFVAVALISLDVSQHGPVVNQFRTPFPLLYMMNVLATNDT
uniref:Secreted peptide n=1 Tax=Rhipicephalus pulchellus TaxID=72859 RepID=L7LQM6_RHIPC